MLNDYRRVRDERPEVVREQSGVSLEMGEECRRIGIIVGIFWHESDFSSNSVIGKIDSMYKIVSPITTFSRRHCGDDYCDFGLHPCRVFDDILPCEKLSAQQYFCDY